MLSKEAGERYNAHLTPPPNDRVSHEAVPSKDLSQAKWARLERRVSSMLLMAVTQTVREELVAILCHLMVRYQPGGLAEKELILRQLESPAGRTTISAFASGSGGDNEQQICQSKNLILSFFSKGSIASDGAGGSQGFVISCVVRSINITGRLKSNFQEHLDVWTAFDCQ